MRLVFRLLAWAFLAALAVAVGGFGLAWYLAARSLPDYDADWRVEGIGAPVEVVRDAHAVPHIFAETDPDAFFALGWTHAQDRLWQMELQRRAARGRLAELFGEEALAVDKTMRALDLPRWARAALPRQSEETRALLEAYAEGVNARIRAVNEEALGRGAPEFFLFGDEGFALWTPTDSLALVKLMALRLTASARAETRRARLLAALDREQVADFDPDYPEAATLSPLPPAGDDGGAPSERAEARPFSPFPEPGFGGASNAWAVAGDRAAAGAPLLATDPHLWLSAPGVWMLARLTSPGFDVIGGTIPGIPAVLIGRNGRFGWGLTTANVDDQDVFIERVNPENQAEYRTPEGWEAFRSRRETIRVKDAPSVTITVRSTRHGPVPPPDGDLDIASVAPPGHVAALAWTALTGEDWSMEAAIGLMRARSIEDGAAAARLHLAPAQNIVMADASGVGMVVAGAAPLRSPESRSRGRTPSLGWVRENDWIGQVPPSAMPRAIRPPAGAVANANNRTTDEPFPLHLSYDWAEPYRIRRIERRLGARAFHTRESFAEMQNDTVSDMARAVLPLIARDLWWGDAGGDGPVAERRRTALELLRDWNGDMAAYDPQPLIFHAWMRALTRRLSEDELGPLFSEMAGLRPLFVERVFHDVAGAARWCDVQMTPEAENCAEISRRALDDALTELAERFGSDPREWRWGDAHRAVHRHAPLGWFAGFDLLVNIDHPSEGGDHTILVGRTPGRGSYPERNVHAPGFRAVYDFADLDRSLFIAATGQSGHPLSRRYDDLNALWRQGDYIPMSLDPEDARAGASGVTTLVPSG